eukprot:jgi/Mesvir1/7459/Mv25812-RA.1
MGVGVRCGVGGRGRSVERIQRMQMTTEHSRQFLQRHYCRLEAMDAHSKT